MCSVWVRVPRISQKDVDHEMTSGALRDHLHFEKYPDMPRSLGFRVRGLPK